MADPYEITAPWDKKKKEYEIIAPWDAENWEPRPLEDIEAGNIAASNVTQWGSTTPPSWVDYSEWDAIKYAAGLGLADTWRGLNQIADFETDEMAESQRVLNSLIDKYGNSVLGTYFGGMIMDPAGWLLPATKAKTVAKMAAWGATSGTLAGSVGYVDPEIPSLVGEGSMTRGEQTLIGGTAGAILSPFIGKLVQKGREKWGPVGEKVWQTLSTRPEAGMGVAGSLMGFNWAEDTSMQEDLYNAFLGSLIGMGLGKGIGRLDKVSEGAWGRFFLAEHQIPDDVLRLKGISRKEMNVIARKFNTVIEKIQKETPEGRELIYKVLVGHASTIDPHIASLTKEARDIMTKYGRELVDLGILGENTYLKNLDTYLHRIYKNPDYHKTKQAWKSVFGGAEIRTVGDELKMRGVPKTVLKGEWEVDKDFFLDSHRKLLDDPNVDLGTEGWEIIRVKYGGDKIADVIDDEVLHSLRTGKLDPDEVLIRRDFTDIERNLMGEVTDAALALSETSRLLANDISAHKYFKSVADAHGLDIPAGTKVPDGYELVPNQKAKFGDLANKFLPKSIHHDIVTMQRWRSGEIFKHPIMKSYRAMHNWWKLTKTAYNLPTHAANFKSNIVMYDLNGGSLKGFGHAVKDLLFPKWRGESSRLAMAREYDVFGGNFIGNDLLRKNKEIYLSYETHAGTGMRGVDALLDIFPDIVKKIGGQTKRFTTDKMQELYTWEDNLFRMGLFNTLIDQGVEPVLAARKAREGFVDYQKVSPMLEILRNSVIPFAAYAYGITPRLAEAAAKQPWKFAKWAAIVAGFNAMGEFYSGDQSRLERERQLMGKHQGSTLFDAPLFPYTMMKLPPAWSPEGPAGTNDNYYYNIARDFPGQQFHQSGFMKYRFPGLPDVMQFGGAFLSGIYDPMRGLDQMTGKVKPIGERFGDVVRQFVPNLPLPWLNTYAGRKMKQGLTKGGFISQTKQNQTFLTAALQNLGFRIEAISPQKLAQSHKFRLQDKVRVIEARARKLRKDLDEKQIEPDEYTEEYDKVLYRMDRVQKEALRLGL